MKKFKLQFLKDMKFICKNQAKIQKTGENADSKVDAAEESACNQIDFKSGINYDEAMLHLSSC